MQLQGIIKFIDEKKNSSNQEGKDFFTRSFAIEMETENGGMIYTNHAGFQATRDKCDLLDPFNPGDEVLVTFGVTASIKSKEGKPSTPKNPRSEQVFTNLTMARIELIKSAVPIGVQQSASSVSNQKPVPVASGAGSDNSDDLPF